MERGSWYSTHWLVGARAPTSKCARERTRMPYVVRSGICRIGGTYLIHIYSIRRFVGSLILLAAGTGPSLGSCHLGSKWRRVGNNEYRTDGTATCELGGAKGGWDVAKSGATSEFCLDPVGKRSRVWTHEVVGLYLERLGWSGSPSERVVSGGASDNARVHRAAAAQAKVWSFHKCMMCLCSKFF